MEMDDETGDDTEESAAAWQKRHADYTIRTRLFNELNREAEWELSDATYEECETSTEAFEAVKLYEEMLEWDRTCRRNFEQYTRECRESSGQRVSEIQAVLEAAREMDGGMPWMV
eukprot:7386252-Prymnesium_polylepis.1